jgi:hypothetical protein
MLASRKKRPSVCQRRWEVVLQGHESYVLTIKVPPW